MASIHAWLKFLGGEYLVSDHLSALFPRHFPHPEKYQSMLRRPGYACVQRRRDGVSGSDGRVHTGGIGHPATHAGRLCIPK